MTTATVPYYNRTSERNEEVHGCYPAMGYSFAAGTTDGPGAFDFRQAMLTDTTFWNTARDLIAVPTSDDKSCHAPKPILVASGRTTFSYETQPKIVPVQILLLGDFAIAAVPAEFTTMSGRRLRKTIEEASVEAGGKKVKVVVAGLSNMYTSYVATPEEYAIQRYEGASTLYGPHTLTIYLHHFNALMKAIVNGESVEEGPSPPFEDYKQITLSTGVVYDGHPFRMYFGDVQEQPNESYTRGETVRASFVAGNPRNNLMHEKTYFTVEKQMGDDQWKVIATDASWETKFKWIRKSTLFAYSDIEFEWQTGPETDGGVYRIQHFGYWRYILGGTYPYNGTTRNFSIL